jgi:hypothetical protein
MATATSLSLTNFAGKFFQASIATEVPGTNLSLRLVGERVKVIFYRFPGKLL